MPELIDLIVTDLLHTEQAGEILDIVHGGSHAADTAAGKGNLGGGREFNHHIRISSFRAQTDNVREWDVLPTELVDTVGVIPHQNEIRSGGLQIGKPADGLVTVNDAIGV